MTRPVFIAAAFACLIFAAPAFAYEGLIVDEAGSASRPSGNGGGYDGLVDWPSTPSASNPYGAAPADDIYGLVKGSGATAQERADNARKAREEQKLRRQQEMTERNIQRTQELQSKLDAQSELQQRRILEHQNEIMRRMQQQQQQRR